VALPPLTPEQRAEALKKAAEARRERAAIKARLKDSAGHRGEEIKKVLEEAETNEVGGDRHLALPQDPRPRLAPGGEARRPLLRVSPDLPTGVGAVTAPAPVTVLAGPTAVGKGTVSAAIRARYPEIWLSVSATTRAPRPGEIDGVHYRFVGEEEFSRLIEDGQMLEWAVVHGRNKYGTPRGPVEEMVAAGRPVLLEIDLAGARQVRETLPGARFVFLAPPDWDTLVHRLVGRGTEDEEERERRLATARVELAAEGEFDVTIVNDSVDRAADELARLLGVRDLT
jgi:guanylate kinase